MGADILYLSPCCESENYYLEYQEGKCRYCKGDGTYWMQNGPDDMDHEICIICDGEGWLKEAIYRCRACGKQFRESELLSEVVDYQDEEA
jgi:hypothetical protein